MARRFKDYYGMPYPQWAIRTPWFDNSWHNDASGRISASTADGGTLDLWVSEENPDEREMANDRYMMAYTPADGDATETEVLWECEDEAEAQRLFAETTTKYFPHS